MKIIYNSIIPAKGFSAINLFGVLFVRKNVILSDRIKNHELIHTAQIKEMLYLFFYMWYLIEWAVKLFKYNGKEAYNNISFEKEAYENNDNLKYLKNRKLFSWTKYL